MGSILIDSAFWLYAMETKGDIPTRRGKIQKVIKLLADSDNPNDFAIQQKIYDKVGIDSDTFTEEEMQYIEREVAKRW